jgi:hypothetical protein
VEEIADLFNQTLKEHLVIEKHYDKETRHMKNRDIQLNWQSELIFKINNLKKYFLW